MIEEVLYPIVCKINEYLSSYILVFLLIGVGLWYSIRTRFVQVRCFGEAMKKTFGNIRLKGGAQKSGMTSFQALATAIAAQVGTGNIIGASGAILTGGPGAIFWMWVIAFFGMATIYAEATLAQKTRIIDKDGTVHGGPVYYITTAFKGGFGKFLAGFFAVAIILALGLMGSMVQSNSIGSTFQTAFGIPAWVMGIVLVIICAIIFLGGVQRLAAVTEKLVPIMAAIFLLGALVVLAIRIQYIPETFGMIFKYAFDPSAIIGGGIGYALKTAISQGAKRGLFSNEAGMGSTPHAHGRCVHRYLCGADPQRPGHHLHPVYQRRSPAQVRRRCRQHHPGQGQPGSDGLRHRVRRVLRQYFRGHLPVLLRLFHGAGLEPVRPHQC